MSGVADWLAVLSTLASVAVAVIGFAGLITAFRSASAPLSRGDIVNIRILLIFSLGALIFALLPMPFAALDPSRLWSSLTLVLGLFLVFWPIQSPRWNRVRGVKPQRPWLFWTVLGLQGLLGLLLIGAVIVGKGSGGLYAGGVAWCLLVAIITFVAQVSSLLPVGDDQDDRA